MIGRILSHVRSPVSVFLLLLNCFVSGCKLAAPQAQQFGDEIAAGAQGRITQIKTIFRQGPYCDDGTLWFRSGVIYAVQPSAAAAGLRPGDRVIAVNGVRGLDSVESTRAIEANAPGS